MTAPMSFESIMIPEWQYDKMVKSYDEAVNKIRELEEELAKYKKCTSL